MKSVFIAALTIPFDCEHYACLVSGLDHSAGRPNHISLLMFKFQIIPLNASASATPPPPISDPVIDPNSPLTPRRAHCCGKDVKTKRADSAVIILHIEQLWNQSRSLCFYCSSQSHSVFKGKNFGVLSVLVLLVITEGN